MIFLFCQKNYLINSMTDFDIRTAGKFLVSFGIWNVIRWPSTHRCIRTHTHCQNSRHAAAAAYTDRPKATHACSLHQENFHFWGQHISFLHMSRHVPLLIDPMA